MSLARYLISFYLLCFAAPGSTPRRVMHFFNKSSVWCYNDITLSNDSVYFYSGSCEGDAALAKGKWRLDSNRLILSNFDRKDCWPTCTVTAEKYDDPEKVHVSVTDYFGKPFANIQLVIFDSAGKQDNIYADSNGSVTVSRSKCAAFDFNYKVYSRDMPNADYVLCYIKDDMNNVSVSIDYPNTTNLDHEIRTIDFEHLEFVMKEGKLYDDSGKVVYDNRYFTDPIPPTKKDAEEMQLKPKEKKVKAPVLRNAPAH